ncbi:hypothetical protein H5U35_03395, partial [Candidatus Aerophobetes bacterium]|nr:hypothetical protein [Candidatus Aerophobetes bacterium]
MNLNILVFSLLVPLVAGVVCYLVRVKRLREILSFGVSVLLFIVSIFLFIKTQKTSYYFVWPWLLDIDFSLRCGNFSSIFLIFISFLALLVSFYSWGFMREGKRVGEYYTYLLFIMAVSWGTVMAGNIVVFLLFWGILGILLYSFLSFGSHRLATKGMFTIGVGDFALILGALFLFRLSGTLEIDSISGISIKGALPLIIFILLATGAIAKIGAIPFHTWIPDASEQIPAPVMAYLPASIDKLVGVYLLFLVVSRFFTFTALSFASLFLSIIAAFTLVVAVMMALISSDMRKVVAYLNISAAGYMVLGMATANAVGIAGRLFYLFGTVLWTSLLFFVTGEVEKKTGTCDLSLLRGLAKLMPSVFVGFLIGNLAISGIPPLNGFFSKWMIYQGIIELGKLEGWGNLWIIWLSVAMFGSAVTLASCMKMTYSAFLSHTDETGAGQKEPLLRGRDFTLKFPT